MTYSRVNAVLHGLVQTVTNLFLATFSDPVKLPGTRLTGFFFFKMNSYFQIFTLQFNSRTYA